MKLPLAKVCWQMFKSLDMVVTTIAFIALTWLCAAQARGWLLIALFGACGAFSGAMLHPGLREGREVGFREYRKALAETLAELRGDDDDDTPPPA